MSFEYEPSSEPLHIAAEQWFTYLTVKIREMQDAKGVRGRSVMWSGTFAKCSCPVGYSQPRLDSKDSGCHSGGKPGANFESISHRCHPILVAFVWELTKETINLPLGCLQGRDKFAKCSCHVIYN